MRIGGQAMRQRKREKHRVDLMIVFASAQAFFSHSQHILYLFPPFLVAMLPIPCSVTSCVFFFLSSLSVHQGEGMKPILFIYVLPFLMWSTVHVSGMWILPHLRYYFSSIYLFYFSHRRFVFDQVSIKPLKNAGFH